MTTRWGKTGLSSAKWEQCFNDAVALATKAEKELNATLKRAEAAEAERDEWYRLSVVASEERDELRDELQTYAKTLALLHEAAETELQRVRYRAALGTETDR